MSRSRKKTPIFTVTGNGNKKSKQLCNRKFRTVSKRNLRKGIEPPYKQDEIMTEWEFDGDGKFYNKEISEEQMRK